MKNKTKKAGLPTSQIRAKIDSSVNEEQRTVELTWTTGAKGLRRDWDLGPYYEELSLEESAVDFSRLREGAPLLAAHTDWTLDGVIGVVERAWLEGNTGKALVRFAKDEASDAIYQKVKDKILRNVSVGYSVQEYTNVSKADDTIPTLRATRWQPAEISIVPIGFDNGAKTRSQETITANDVEIITRSEDSKENQVTEEEKKALAEKAAQDAITAERKRSSDIRKLVTEAGLESTLADNFIERGLPVDEAKKNVEAMKVAIEQSKKTEIASTVRAEVGTSHAEKKRQGFEEGLLHRINPTEFKVTEAGKEFYGKSLLRQCEIVVPRNTMESDAKYATRVMSSSDLPLALANVAEKGLQKQYELQPKTFTQWTRSDSLRNYKSYSQVKSGDYASLIERPEGKPFEQGSFSEKNETVQLKDWGIIHAFTSQMLANDDMGVLSRMASSGGIAVARLENTQAYSALTTNKTMQDGVALYHSTHANLGSAAAISATTVGEAYKLMRKQTSTGGLDKLNLYPKFFVCGPDQETTARQFFTAVNAQQTSNVNIFQGSMQVIVDGALTGNQYYFLADPSQIDTIVCYRLEGQESPQIESRVDFNTNSLQLKVAHAFIAAPMDWRGIVKNAGQ